MPIYEGSRYERAMVVPVQGSDGVHRSTILPALGVPEIGEYTAYRAAAGDRMDLLAATAYGDPEMWWCIADANPQLSFVDELAPGTVLRIPVLTEADMT